MEIVWELNALPWITATVTTDLRMNLYVSKAVRRGDPILDPLVKWKQGFNYTLLDEQEYEDEGMMFGQAVSRQYQLAERRASVRSPERFPTETV